MRVEASGNAYSKLMVVTDFPSSGDTKSLLSGHEGEILDDWLEGIGLKRNNIWLSSVYKIRPHRGDPRKLNEVVNIPDAQNEFLDEVRQIDPNVIVPLGDTALKFLTDKRYKIKDYRGSILLSPNTSKKVVGTFHPSVFTFQNIWNRKEEDEDESEKNVTFAHRYVSQLDFQRAYEESHTPDYTVPNIRVDIARNSATLWKFLDEYSDKREVGVDIEVINCVPVSIALAFNDYHACCIPLVSLDKLQPEWQIPHAELAIMHKMLIDLFNTEGIVIFGQNFKFDQTALEVICAWGRYLNPQIQVIDCGILAHALHPEFPKNLGFLNSIYTRLPFYKDEGREFNYKKQSFKVFFEYNGKDACSQFAIAKQLLQYLSENKPELWPNWKEEFVDDYINKLHYFYKEMESVGILVDKERRKFYIDKYDALYKECRERLDVVAGFECNPHSPKDVPLLLYKELKLPLRKDCSRQTLVALLNNVAKQPRAKEAIQLVLNARRLRKANSTYYKARLDYDGRMKTSININGAETGRTSNKILKAPVRPDKMGIAFMTMTKHGDIGHELREIFIPDPDWAFVEIDLSQAEARVVAHLSNDDALLRKFEQGVDIHSEMACMISGRKWDGKRVAKDERFIGKMGRHARNYDVGPDIFMQQVNAEAKKHNIEMNMSAFRSKQVLKAVKEATPLVEEVFHAGIKSELSNRRYLINPFGRFREFYGRFDERLFKEGYANIPQGTVIDHLRFACFRAKPLLTPHKYRWFMEAHDAIYALVRLNYIQDYAAIMRRCILHPIDFSRSSLRRGLLVIPCDIQVGYKNLKEMEEYKVD
jgi:uracil-DNA glycosylase family 4